MDIHFKIIVPFYNAERWILSCLKSVHAQKYLNYECVVVDDCSTDKSSQIINDYISDKDRFKLVRTEKN